MILIQNPSRGLGPGTAAKPERGLGRDQKRGLTRRRHEDDTGKEAGLGKERKPGLKRVGGTHLRLGPGAAAGPERGLGRDWKRGLKRRRHEHESGKEAGLGKERKLREPAKNLVSYNVFTLSDRTNGPKPCILSCVGACGREKRAKALCFTICSRLRGGRWGQQPLFYNVFALSETAKRPKTLHFTMVSRLRKRRSGQRPFK